MINLLHVLFLEDRLADVELMLHELRIAGFDPVWQTVETEQDYLTGITPQLDLILADYALPQFNGMKALDLLIAQGLDIPFILVSGTIEEELAVSALKRGAADYLIKDRLARLGQATRSALENRRVRQLERKAVDDLRRSEERFRKSVENMLDCFGIYSAIRDEAGDIIDFRVDYVNSSAGQSGLMPSKQEVGYNLLDVRPEHQTSGLFYEYCQVVETGEPLIKESLGYTTVSGENYLEQAIDIHVTKLEDGIAATWRDVTERKRAEEELRHLSTHDILTGLYNRTYFETEVSRLKQCRQYPVSVIMVDVDRMKQMNDSQGHSAGDELLRRTSAILKLSFRAEDVVARIGGDEFAVLLPQTDEDAVQTILNRIRVNLFTNQILQDSPILSFSIGAATAENGEKLEEVIHRADKSMYRDKFERTRPAMARARRKKES